ncbi:MAG: NAD-dependent epimerase/dehydratase family protein [Kiritimatiellae bacterium]|jgi:nucleoside-diphosphate-sugar epimerase|nr:NAD-dependent epimerase/dehydratase family protein [Kiritimatiellia bacterium]
MKVLFIGGTGNISEACVQRCLSQGQTVSVVTRGANKLPDGVEAIVTDRYKQDDFQQAIEGKSFDVVINFVGYKLPELEIDYKLFAGKIRQYIFISSATVYKKPHTQIPITEDYALGNPWSEYAQNKQKCEEWLMDKNNRNLFPVTIVRPSHTFSEKWVPNIISSGTWTIPNRLINKKTLFLHDGGKSLWTLTSSSDFAIGLCGLIGLDKSIGEAFHITSDEANSWKAIYDRYPIELGLEPPDYVSIPTDFICENFPEFISSLKGDKAENAVFDNSKIKSYVPDFKCKNSMIEGIRKSMQWFLADKERQVVDKKADEKIEKILNAYQEANSEVI